MSGRSGEQWCDEPCCSVCPRVAKRMECLECGYPFSEAMFAWDGTTPHQPSVIGPDGRLLVVSSDE